MNRITIQDIGKHVGLSRNTVAKALTDGEVSFETKVTVIRAAQELGYRKLDPEVAEKYADAKLKSETGTILVLFDRGNSPFWNRVITGISDAVSENGYRMQLHIVSKSDEDAAQTIKAAAPDVRGVIMLCLFEKRFIECVTKLGVPLAFFQIPANGVDLLKYGSAITIEGKEVYRQMVEHALDCGKTDFVFLGHNEDTFNSQLKWLGFREALERKDLMPPRNRILNSFSKGSYYDVSSIGALLNTLDPLPEVIACCNDDIMRLTADALERREHGLSERIMLIGFDYSCEEGFYHTGMLTARVNMEEVGARLVQAILDKLRSPKYSNVLIMLPSECVIF